ncbi:MAG TPA: hypothetical protein VH370_03510 [Humisphaera sp.]|nr:hypothetical protein [Humisphaera sp.]
MSKLLDCLPTVRPELESLYSSPGRHYHNLDHIHKCLELLADVREQCDDPDAMEIAIWFHDCIYDPTRRDNEEASADVAARLLGECGISPDQIERVRELILATKHAVQPADPDSQLLVDIDLAILGSAPGTFDDYEGGIRLEYAHVPDDAFAKGRAQILEMFLARPRIFLTEYFGQRFESAARQNLARSISRLRAAGCDRTP